MKYIGIDGCKAGWLLVGLHEGGRTSFSLLNSILELSGYLASVDRVLIDIPIGLRGRQPDERLCDKQARAVLRPKRASSVFPAPSRCALPFHSYLEANEHNRECTGKGLTRQTFNILPKIREVDQFLRNEERRRKVHEMHPEICFWALNNCQAMHYNKKTEEGYQERIALLNRYYRGSRNFIERVMQQYTRSKVARDDIVDALVGAVTASHAKSLQRFPDTPEIDELGLPMEIVYWAP